MQSVAPECESSQPAVTLLHPEVCAKSPQIDFRLTQLLERAPKYVVHAELSSVSRLARARAMGE